MCPASYNGHACLARAERNQRPYSDLGSFRQEALMRSIRLSIGLTLGGLATLLLAACGGTTGTVTGSGPAASSSALIHTASMKVGDKTETVLKNDKGLTLYYFTADTSTKIACTGGCATNRTPPPPTPRTPTTQPPPPDPH